ncbi:MAG: TetR/AcrR family transcriptional regulator [Candidatus Kryptoniota bacterium]
MRTKKGNKEKDILEASIRVFASHGYYQAKISEIARAAGVATGSVYLYYKNKKTLLYKVFEHLWKELENESRLIAGRHDINPIEKLDSIIDLFFDKLISNPDLAKVYAKELTFILQDNNASVIRPYDKFSDFATQVFQEGVKKGLIHPHLNVTVLRHFLLGGLRAVIHEWANHPPDVSLNTLRDNVKSVIKHGVVQNPV